MNTPPHDAPDQHDHSDRDHEHYLSWAESMVEPLAERAADASRRRELPPETLADAERGGMDTMALPRRLGGAGLGLRTIAETTRILAHGCISSAWTLSFYTLHNWFIARGPKALQDDVFSRQAFTRMPCPLAPTGTAVPVDGGYSLTGRWEWATGVQHGDWVMVNAFVDRDGAPEATFCVAPIDDVEVIDVWHTSGMRGTGSNSVVADGLFIPEHRTFSAADLRSDTPPGAQVHPEPFVRYPMTPVLTLVAAAPAIGGAEAAVDGFRAYAQSRVLPYTLGDRQIEQPAAQIRLAEALATVRAARLVWRDAIDRLCDAYDAGIRIERAQRGDLRLASAHAVRLAIDAVGIVLEGAGASVHFEDSALQRINRDLFTLRGHVVFDWDRAAQLAGKLELGLDPDITDML